MPQQGTDPVRLIQIGAGSMGRGWLRTIAEHRGVELVGLVDLDVDLARQAAADAGHERAAVAGSLSALAVEADAVINVTIPEAHAPTSEQALFAGLPVLCEKPIAPTVAAGLGMAAAAEASGQLLMPGLEPEDTARGDHAVERADVALQLKPLLAPKLVSAAQERVFYEIESPLVPVLAEMELLT